MQLNMFLLHYTQKYIHDSSIFLTEKKYLVACYFFVSAIKYKATIVDIIYVSSYNNLSASTE